jgi:FtsZ-binding cell division protein ZapB
MGTKPLEIKCPSCGHYDNSKTLKPDPKHYRWSDETTDLFERIAGQDLSFRKATKQCTHCGAEFTLVKMSRHYLEAMIEEIQRLTGEVKQLTWSKQSLQKASERAEAKNNALESTNQRLLEENRVMKAKLKAINDIAKSDDESYGNFTGSEFTAIELRDLGVN